MEVSQFLSMMSALLPLHLHLTVLCSAHYGFCGADVAASGALGGGVRSSICQRWLAPVRAPRQQSFAHWMLSGGFEGFAMYPVNSNYIVESSVGRRVPELVMLWTVSLRHRPAREAIDDIAAPAAAEPATDVTQAAR